MQRFGARLASLRPRSRIIEANSGTVADEQARPQLRLTACVLASYQELVSGGMAQGHALELVNDAFTSIGRTTLRLVDRLK